MAEVFLDVVNMSLTASWLIAVIIVLRILLKKAPKWLMPVLWGVAGLRLIIPFSLESNLSLIPNAKPLPEEMLNENTFLVYSGVPVIDEPVNRFLAGREVEAASEKMTGQGHLMTVLGIVWVIGVCVMLLYALFSYIRLKSQVRASIRYEGNVWLSDQISSPFILGVIRPKIFLPIGLDSENERYVLAHERAHLKRLDHIIKPIGFVVLCVYWFNPLVWVAYILLCKDIELACDEKVIAGYEFGEKKAYAAALLDCSMHRRMVMACPLAFGEVGVKERVKSVLNYKKPAFWIIIIALVVCAVTGVCFLTNPPQRSEDVEVQNANAHTETESSAEFDIRDGTGESVADWLSVELPHGYGISNYYDNIGYMGGSLILPKSYDVIEGIDESGFSPMEWRYSGLITRIPAGQTDIKYENGIPELSGIPMQNHSEQEYKDVIGLERSTHRWPAIMLKVNHDLYTPPQLDDLQKKGVTVKKEDTTSDYWEFWYVKQGEETYYVITLSAKEFSQKEAIEIAKSVTIKG